METNTPGAAINTALFSWNQINIHNLKIEYEIR